MSFELAISRRAVVFILFAIILVISSSFAYAYLPSATIEITPTTETKSTNQTIQVSEAVSSPDFISFKLPAQIITTEIKEEQIINRDGENVFDDFAKGKITLHNEQSDEQQLLPQTHLRHEDTGVFFLTDTGVAIPGQGETGITVTAKEKGPNGNVKPGKFIVDKLPPYTQQKVYGESLQEFSGGIAVSTPVSEEEVAQASDKLFQSLQEQLRGDLTAKAKGAPLRSDLIEFQKTEPNVSVPIGSHADKYRISVTASAKAFLIDENDLLGLTLLKLRSLTTPEQEFIAYDPLSFSITMTKRDFIRGEALIEGSLSGSFAQKIGPKTFNPDNIAGLSEEEVKEQLLQLPGVGDVNIKFFPFWVKAVPAHSSAVEVVIKEIPE